MSRISRLITGFVCWSLLLSTALLGQSFQGTIRGLVRDASGGFVPGATITLTNEMTRTMRETVSNDAGNYTFPLVDPGTYQVQVDLPGFKRFVQGNLVVNTQATLTVDVSLDLGSQEETIQVTAQAPLVDTSNASTSTVLDTEQITTLPIVGSSGRSVFTLSNITPTVLPTSNITAGMSDLGNVSFTTVAGSPAGTNQYLLDGVPISDIINRPIFTPGADAIQEMKVHVATYDAESGRTGGGVWNAIVKSGSNTMHGTAFWTTQQPEWRANAFFNNRNGIAKPNNPAYNYAGTFGGPLVVPGVYNGRNKTFFFLSEEGYRIRNQSSGTFSVPTALERRGDFSQSRNAAGALNVIYDPLTTRTVNGVVVRDAFPGNVIPGDRLNAVGLNILSYYPLPKVAGATGTNNYTNQAKTDDTTGDGFMGKLDHQFFPWWSISGSYVKGQYYIPTANTLGSAACCTSVSNDRKVSATAINNTFVMGPNTVGAVRFGYNNFPTVNFPLNAGFDPVSLGFPNYAYQTRYFPAIMATGFSQLSGVKATLETYKSRNLSGSLSRQMGRHSLKGGVEYRGIYLDYTDMTDAAGTYNFTGQFTQADPTRAAANTGSAIADLLLGLPFSGQISQTQLFQHYLHYYGAFAQDDFRISSKLTLNLGLRYEFETGLKEKNDNMVVGFDRTIASPLAQYKLGTSGGLIFADEGGVEECCNLSTLKFAPRLGFAYAVTPKMAVRGGYAIYYPPAQYGPANIMQSGYTRLTPLVSTLDGGRTPIPGYSLSNPFPGGPLPVTGDAAGLLSGVGTAISAYDQRLESPIIHQYSVNVQRELPGNMAVELGYLGSNSKNLPPAASGGGNPATAPGRVNLNQLDPQYYALGSAYLATQVANPFYQNGGAGVVGSPTISNYQLLLPYPQFASVNVLGSTSKARYHAALVKVDKRLSRGLSFSTNYVWSRNNDDEFGLNSYAGAQNVYNLDAEYGLSVYDVEHRVTGIASYELPQFTSRPWVGLALGGWQISTTTTYQTGFPLTITQPNLNASIGGAVQRPNMTGVAPETPGSVADRIDGYINPAAFSSVPQYSFGDTPRTLSMRAPGSAYWNLALSKTFSIGGQARLEVRGQAANVFNQTSFGIPNTTFTNANFGRITSTAGVGARVVTLGGRLSF